jgi:hypothetical protein
VDSRGVAPSNATLLGVKLVGDTSSRIRSKREGLNACIQGAAVNSQVSSVFQTYFRLDSKTDRVPTIGNVRVQSIAGVRVLSQ